MTEETLFWGREVGTKTLESHMRPGLIFLDCIQINLLLPVPLTHFKKKKLFNFFKHCIPRAQRYPLLP